MSQQFQNDVRMGLTYVIQGEKVAVDTLKRIEQYERVHLKALTQINDSIQKSAQKRTKSQQRNAKRTQGFYKQTIRTLRNMRWEIITVMFFFRELGEIITKTFEAMAESSENAATRGGIKALAVGYETQLKTIVENLQEVADNTLSTMEAVTLAQTGLTTDLGQFADQYDEYWQAARVAQVSVGGEAEEIFKAIAEAVAKADAEILDNVTTVYQARGAVQEYADSIGVAVDDLEEWQKQQAIMQRVTEVTNTLLENGADKALESGDSFKKLSSSWKNLKDLAGNLALVNSLVEALAWGVRQFSEYLIWSNANLAATVEYIKILYDFVKDGPIQGGLRLGQQIINDPGGLWGQVAESRQDAQARYWESLGRFEEQEGTGLPLPSELFEEPEEEKDRERSIEAILKQIEKHDELVRKHQERLADMWQDYQDEIADIEAKAEKDMARARREAQRDREKAWRKYNRKLFEEFRDFNRKERQELEDHQQDVRQDREKFRVESVQNERLYQYERSLLVAEGDVLAIEDLDARYALEQQARQENQQLEEQQRQEKFDLEKAQRRENFDVELDDMRYQHNERLREIDIQERERLEEIRQRREEALAEAEADYERQRQSEIENQEQRLEQWARYWDNVARQTEVGTAKMTEIIEAIYGPTGEATQILQTFQDESERTLATIQMIEDILGERTKTGRSHIGIGSWRSSGLGAIGGRAFGGDEWFSRPTLLMVGEGQTPERVRTSPSYGGQVSLSWAGGPIPLQGSGGLENANLSGVGDAIASGIVASLRKGLVE